MNDRERHRVDGTLYLPAVSNAQNPLYWRVLGGIGREGIAIRWRDEWNTDPLYSALSASDPLTGLLSVKSATGL